MIRIGSFLAVLCVALMMVAPSLAQNVDRITNDAPVVTYEISVRSGETVVITMSRVSGDLVPFLAFKPPTGTLIRQEADESGERAVLTYEVTRTGRYTLSATRQDAEDGTTTGDFILTIEGAASIDDRYSPIFVEPAQVLRSTGTLDGTYEGSISNSAYVTYYLANLQRGTQLTMIATSDTLEPSLVLLNLEGRTEARGRDSVSVDGQSQQSLTVNLPTGWYVIVTTRFDFDLGITQGDYQLIIED